MSQVTAVRSRAITEHVAPGVTTLAVNYPPEVEAGDKLVVVCGGETGTFTATGWTSIAALAGGGGSQNVMWQDADGTEGGTTFDVTINQTAQDHAFVTFAVADPNGDPEAEIVTTGGSSVSPQITPSGGSQHYVIIATTVVDLARDITAWPTGLEQWIGQQPGGGQTTATCETEAVGSTFGPYNWTHDADGYVAATIAVPCDAASPAGFPVQETSATSLWTTDATSQTLTLPAGVAAGDILTAEISVDDTATATITDWTVIGSQTADDAGAPCTVTLLAKEADGGEGATATVTLSSSQMGAAVARRFSDATMDDIEAAFDGMTGNIDEPDPPSLTPAGGSGKIAWVVGFGQDSNVPVTQRLSVNFGAAPVEVRQTNSSGAGLASGLRVVESSTEDPGTARTAIASRTVAYTMAIYPDAAPPPPPAGGGNRMGTDRAIRKPPRTPR